MVLGAYRNLRRLQRQQLALQELPVAQLTALTANVNRDPAKSKEFKARDFCFFAEEQDSASQAPFAPEVAAVALELRHQQRAPELLLAVWPQVLASVQQDTKPPKVRALRSDDGAVWVLAPRWEGKNVRGGLVLVRGAICGTLRLRDLDRSILAYDVLIPRRPGYGWIEAGTLLQAAGAAT